MFKKCLIFEIFNNEYYQNENYHIKYQISKSGKGIEITNEQLLKIKAVTSECTENHVQKFFLCSVNKKFSPGFYV